MTLRRLKRRVLVAALATVLVGGAIGNIYLFSPARADTAAPAAPAPATRVEVAPAVRAPLPRAVQVVGEVESREEVTLRSEIAGRIARIAFADGDAVRAGELLIQLDASVQSAELDRARANVGLVESNVSRFGRLVQTGAGSRMQLEEAQASLALAHANVRLAQANLAKTRIVAPFTGRIGIRSVSPGDYVTPGDALVNVDKTDEVKVLFTVPERYLHDLRQGVTVDLTADALPGRTLQATVIATESRIAADSRSLRVQALAKNDDGALYPGQFATVNLPIAAIDDALLVPDQALVPLGGDTFVFRVADGVARRVAVKTGARTGSQAQIVDGLAAGDLVVTAGQQKIADGAPVEVAATTLVHLLATPEEPEAGLD